MAEGSSSLILSALFLLMAVLYSAVGQGGGSGYLAAMAFLDTPPETMRLTALSLNVVVAAVALWRFREAGFFERSLFLPLALGSVPAAFLGGSLTLPAEVFRPLVGVVLFWAAYRLVRGGRVSDGSEVPPSLSASLAVGGGIGFFSGLIGIGGGIFLAPVLILRGWASVKTAAAVSAAFILVNSLSALGGVLTHAPPIPPYLPAWLAVVVVGGWVGAGLGAGSLPPRTLKKVLALVLLVGGVKLVLPF